MPDRQAVEDVLTEHGDRLLALTGVVGVGSGEREGAPVIIVLAEREEIEDLPASIGGYDVVVEVTGEFRAVR